MSSKYTRYDSSEEISHQPAEWNRFTKSSTRAALETHFLNQGMSYEEAKKAAQRMWDTQSKTNGSGNDDAASDVGSEAPSMLSTRGAGGSIGGSIRGRSGFQSSGQQFNEPRWQSSYDNLLKQGFDSDTAEEAVRDTISREQNDRQTMKTDMQIPNELRLVRRQNLSNAMELRTTTSHAARPNNSFDLGNRADRGTLHGNDRNTGRYFMGHDDVDEDTRDQVRDIYRNLSNRFLPDSQNPFKQGQSSRGYGGDQGNFGNPFNSRQGRSIGMDQGHYDNIPANIPPGARIMSRGSQEGYFVERRTGGPQGYRTQGNDRNGGNHGGEYGSFDTSKYY